MTWASGFAAAARIHCGHKLKSRRVSHVMVGAGDDRLTCLEGLPQRFQHARLEFGKLVEKQHAVVGEADLSGSRDRPAAYQPGVRDRVVRRAERPSRDESAA
jgi:hypothetical protein